MPKDVVSFWNDENILKSFAVMVAELEYTKSHLTPYFRCVNCMVCKLYCSEAV